MDAHGIHGAAIGGIMEPILLTQGETAAILSVSIATVVRWTRWGVMPKPITIKGVIRYHRETIIEWAREGCPHVARAGWRASAR